MYNKNIKYTIKIIKLIYNNKNNIKWYKDDTNKILLIYIYSYFYLIMKKIYNCLIINDWYVYIG